MWKKALSILFVFVCGFGLGIIAGIFTTKQSLAGTITKQQRIITEQRAQLDELLDSVRSAVARSETVRGGINESLRTAGSIADRSKRIVYLIETLGAAALGLEEIEQRLRAEQQSFAAQP